MNHELPDVQAGFREARGTRDQIDNIRWIIEKESSRKTSISAFGKPKDKCLLICSSQRKAMPKNAQTTAQLHSSHTLVK